MVTIELRLSWNKSFVSLITGKQLILFIKQSIPIEIIDNFIAVYAYQLPMMVIFSDVSLINVKEEQCLFYRCYLLTFHLSIDILLV